MKENNFLGVLNVRKEKGYTSHDVVAIVRKITRAKTGHTGTLDPDATGVLPICLGRATKLAEYFAAEDKTYVAEIVFGITTNTGDTSGEILSKTDAAVGFEEFRAAAESFKGEYLQTPPMFSAVKIGGKKLYELARKGLEIERPARAVKIFDIRAFEKSGKFFFETTCSKGTYIRSLCADIGEKLGTGAVMGELTRTRSGVFSLEDSVTLDEIRAAAERGQLDEKILPVERLLLYPAVFVRSEGLARALNGNPLPPELIECQSLRDGGLGEGNFSKFPSPKVFWLKSPEDKLIGLFAKKGDVIRAEVML